MIKIIVVGVLVTLLGLFAMSKMDSANQSESQGGGLEDSLVVSSDDSPDGTKDVEIDGEVKHPGVYGMSPEGTLGELIAKAGGVTDEADTDAYFETYVIGEWTYFFIPAKGASYCEPKESEKLNLNAADLTAEKILSVLKPAGINATDAKAILAYRNENGPFKAIEELKNVSGIGDKKYEKAKSLVSLK